jgi:single-strand DNA-binding protein
VSQNYVRVSGGITREPEFRVFDSGSPLWTATIAVNGTRYDSQQRTQVVKTTFVSIQAWGWLAEEIMDLGLDRGDEVLVEGELDQSEYEKDGKTERRTRVTILRLTPVRRRSTPTTPGAGGSRRIPDRIPGQPGGWDAPPQDEPPF